MSEGMYLEDFAVGLALDFGSYPVEREDMLEYSRKWDALPIHVETESGVAARHGGLIASGEYTMAVKQNILSRHPIRESIIGAIGHDKVRFLKPVRAGDTLRLTGECVEVRPSRSKPDRGVVKILMRIANQHDESVITYTDLVMIARRPKAASEARSATQSA